ncbi:hypothetical protein [Novipirellula maiorica]|uniref:hypothetical protein n=1 Tax=Novipirellula maiorica TaxID=1265734 RepID=UPI00059532B0|nr:hypothetical protein [Rhodopirellula maiorica]
MQNDANLVEVGNSINEWLKRHPRVDRLNPVLLCQDLKVRPFEIARFLHEMTLSGALTVTYSPIMPSGEVSLDEFESPVEIEDRILLDGFDRPYQVDERKIVPVYRPVREKV